MYSGSKGSVDDGGYSQAVNRFEGYLRKIMRKLVLAGLVTSIPGNNGGFRLAKDPSKISLLDIVEASEGTIKTYPDMGFIENIF